VPGDYVMRIVNYAAEGTTWTASVERFGSGAPAHYEEVGKETWTLTCESGDGKKVYETHKVFVDRGESVSLNLACGRSQTPVEPGRTNAPRAKKRATAAKIKKAKKARATCVRKAKKKANAKRRRAAKRACARAYNRRVRRIRARARR
jgi:hypothetical protein